ncbi:hypothetical protein [Magnetococcus sp. PR-3]|uniref:hypothetical protein n=1 Tax=Magnetococcus sp. PR-3 TaxID=3120355 RepID=UPI002FCE51F0
MKPLQFTLFCLSIFILSGCVSTRDANTVETKQRLDTSLSCQQLEVEYKTNTEIAANKISKNNTSDGQDILLGFLIWPGLADFKNADGTEGNALLDRNIYLRELAKSKACDLAYWPSQPNRYN